MKIRIPTPAMTAAVSQISTCRRAVILQDPKVRSRFIMLAIIPQHGPAERDCVHHRDPGSGS